MINKTASFAYMIPGIDNRANETINMVCKKFGVRRFDVLRTTRLKEFVEARQVCQYFLKKYNNPMLVHTDSQYLTLRKIAHLTGVNHHATVLNGIKKVEENIDINKLFTTQDQKEFRKKMNFLDVRFKELFYYKKEGTLSINNFRNKPEWEQDKVLIGLGLRDDT